MYTRSIKYITISKKSNYWDKVISFTKANENDFVPPISFRMPILDYFERFNVTNGFVIIIIKGHEIIGATAGWYHNKDFNSAYIQFLLIDKRYRNRIIARDFISYTFKECRKHKAIFVKTRTWSTNLASQPLINALGFYRINTIINDREEGIHTYEYARSVYHSNSVSGIKKLGVLGGVGSKASAKFVYELYSLNSQNNKEQNQIPIVLLSEPGIPDRTSVYNGELQQCLIAPLQKAIDTFVREGVSHFIITCFSFHAFLNKLNIPKSIKLISLIDYTDELLEYKSNKCIVLGTDTTYLRKPFKQTGLIYPNPDDQKKVHEEIYKLKSGHSEEIVVLNLTSILNNYQFDSILLACTDLYLLSDLFQEYDVINPLKTIAFDICNIWKNDIISANIKT